MKRQRKNNAGNAATLAMLIALAMIFSYIESQIPPFFTVPGMKLGLTNVVVLVALYKRGSASAMTVNIIRIVLVSLLFGGISAMIYSLSGGMLSTFIMILMKRTGKFKTVTVSAVGGVSHNAGQIIAAMFMLNTTGIVWYLAVLWFTGMITGILIGLLGELLLRRLPDKLFEG